MVAGVARWRWHDRLALTPTGRLARAAALLALAWLASGTRAGFVVAMGLTIVLALITAFDAIMLPSAPDFAVSRECPATIGVADEAQGICEIASRWGRTLDVSLVHAIPEAALSDATVFSTVRLAPHAMVTLPWSATGVARGGAPLGALALRVETPLGLVSRTFRYEMPDRVIVAPSLSGVQRFRWLAVHQRLASAGIRDARRLGEGRSFARLRDYVPGDDPRHIDWKATARRGHPITREFTVEQSQTVFVLIDAGRSMTQLVGDFPRFEYALSSALVLADVAVSAGDRVGAMVFDDALRALVPAQRGLAAIQAIRTALVPLQPTMVEPDYGSAFRVLAQRQRKRALVVLITDVLDARAARSLLAHFTRGASQHLAIVVALRNEALVAAAAAEAPSARAVYSTAAAEEILIERATAMRRMRDAGVIVLDVAPTAMAAAVVGQYLELKARGAL